MPKRQVVEQVAVDLLSQAEIARLCGITRQAVNQWVRGGKLPTVGGTALVWRADFERFAQEHNIVFDVGAGVKVDAVEVSSAR